MQDLSVNADKAMKRLRKIYMEETKIGEDHPDNRESYIQHLLEHDYELSAEECEAFGITTPSDDDDEVELSDERVELLQNYVKKLAAEQKKENAKKEAEEKEGGKKKAPAKKAAPKATPKKKPAKKDETETKSE
jgi:hypothetical protein